MHRVRTSQPPLACGIDWDNPVTRDLHHACTLAEGGKFFIATRNTVRQADGVHTYLTGSAHSPNGRAGVFSATQAAAAVGVFTAQSDSIAATNEFSILFWGRVTTSGGAGAGRMWQGADSTAHFCFYNATNLRGLSINTRVFTLPMSDNVDHLVIVTANSATTTPVLQGFVDGVAVTLASFSGTPAAAPLSGGFAWGNNAIPAGIRVLGGNFILGILARRIWTRAEIDALSRNPWQVFKPARRSIQVPAKLPQLAPILAQ